MRNSQQPPKKAPSQTAPKPLWRRILSWVIPITIGAALAFCVDYSAITDYIDSFGYEPTGEVARLINNIELTNRGERIIKASRPELMDADNFNAMCDDDADSKISVLGCHANRRIYVYNITNDELDGIKEAVLAHELLHAVWNRAKIYTRNEFEPLLRAEYEKHKDELAEHMESYSDEIFVDELHSVIGTQIKPDLLPQKLRDHYANIFKNQDKIIAYYNQYNDKFVKLHQQIVSDGAKIDEMKAKLEQRKTNYQTNSAKLNSEIDAFNRRNQQGYYGDNPVAFANDRAALVARQEALHEEYKGIVEDVNAINALVKTYNKNLAHSQELYGSINSQNKKEEQVTE